MHTNFSFINIAFNLTIFSLLAIKLYELIKKLALPFLHDLIEQEKHHQTELIEKDRLINNSHQNVQNQLMQQKKTFLDLDAKVKQWYELAKKQQVETELFQNQMAQEVAKKRVIQERHYTAMMVSKAVIPEAIKEAKDELKKINRNRGNIELERLIKSLAHQKQKES